jgi:8-oxo-dGTP pyrophosphatase MutT (NUDIX family)
MRWTTHGERPLYQSEWVNLTLADVEIPGVRRFEHHVVRMPRESVNVAVVNEAGSTLMIWRHRFISDTWGWELPAGWVDPGEEPIVAGRREVQDETGWRPADLVHLCSFYADYGLTDSHFHSFYATGADHVGDPTEPEESSRIEWIPNSRLYELMTTGRIVDGPSLVALLLVLKRLGG